MTDERHHLPEAFDAAGNEDPTTEDVQKGEFGLGRLVNSVVPEEVREARREASDTDGVSKVGEASRESFPASDPPAFNAKAAPRPRPKGQKTSAL